MSPRRKLIAGNWKMNPPTLAEAAGLASVMTDVVEVFEGVDVVICPPTIFLQPLGSIIRGSAMAIGAQTMHWAAQGAYTGETSPAMLAGPHGQSVAQYVIVGHSERRQYDGETDEAVGRKVATAVEYGLTPIAAIGERLAERQAGEADAVIDRQLRAAVGGVDGLARRALAIAYEPVWAIGTGVAASPADAQAASRRIRDILRERFGEDADRVPILYGGSVTGDNAAGFFAQPDVDGALVGGASLNADQFAAIVAAVAAAR